MRTADEVVSDWRAQIQRRQELVEELALCEQLMKAHWLELNIIGLRLNREKAAQVAPVMPPVLETPAMVSEPVSPTSLPITREDLCKLVLDMLRKGRSSLEVKIWLDEQGIVDAENGKPISNHRIGGYCALLKNPPPKMTLPAPRVGDATLTVTDGGVTRHLDEKIMARIIRRMLAFPTGVWFSSHFVKKILERYRPDMRWPASLAMLYLRCLVERGTIVRNGRKGPAVRFRREHRSTGGPLG